jgi:hypothetical protein
MFRLKLQYENEMKPPIGGSGGGITGGGGEGGGGGGGHGGGGRITGRPARPWPDETPRPRLRPCDGTQRQWWYDRVTDCFNTMKTNVRMYHGCLNHYDCPNLPSPLRDVCIRSAETKCRNCCTTLPLKDSDKAACVAGANEVLDFIDCYMPKDLQDEFIGRWR